MFFDECRSNLRAGQTKRNAATGMYAAAGEVQAFDAAIVGVPHKRSVAAVGAGAIQ